MKTVNSKMEKTYPRPEPKPQRLQLSTGETLLTGRDIPDFTGRPQTLAMVVKFLGATIVEDEK